MRYLWAFLVVFVAGTLFVACYAPNFGSPGYYCDPDENPPCPEGQSCVNGRCVNDRGGNNNVDEDEDLKTPASTDLKGADLKSTDMKKPADLVEPQSTEGNTCGGYVSCVNACTTDTCVSACDAALDLDGQAKIQAAVQCLYDYCEFTAGDCEYDPVFGEYADSFSANPGDCQACVNNAATPLTMESCSPANDPDCAPSACNADNQACFNDT
jgi:hypothetical protein